MTDDVARPDLVDPDDLLAVIRGERGYALSYHELLARTDPRMLLAYRQLYSEFTLQPRHLDARRRELVWTGLLTAASEHVGSLHLERALAAGVPTAELRAAVRLAGVAEAWDALHFAHSRWGDLLGSDDHEAGYDQLVAAARGPLTAAEAELVLLVCAGSRMCEDQYVAHLRRAYAMDVSEVEIVETVSYLLLPKGANTLLWATDLYLDQFRQGTLVPGGTLESVSHDVRRH
ncbi:carboxymuconolactone decarboxylase family protein [Euzebya rosea]|uniref:carboxymuconolactone decarboxylase family protein n=1 Tax=Euzebya rosea TaxID=2052804 RepID=UPI000D3EA347|nr:carboxymuconolactone decarboxylase family protein [Euzebya rosea]